MRATRRIPTTWPDGLLRIDEGASPTTFRRVCGLSAVVPGRDGQGMTSSRQQVSRRTFLAGGGAAVGIAAIGAPRARASGSGRGTLEGIWYTDGYGTTVSIAAGRGLIFQTTLFSRVET